MCVFKWKWRDVVGDMNKVRIIRLGFKNVLYKEWWDNWVELIGEIVNVNFGGFFFLGRKIELLKSFVCRYLENFKWYKNVMLRMVFFVMCCFDCGYFLGRILDLICYLGIYFR